MIEKWQFYHYDTSPTVKYETEILFEAGFTEAEILCNWGAVYI